MTDDGAHKDQLLEKARTGDSDFSRIQESRVSPAMDSRAGDAQGTIPTGIPIGQQPPNVNITTPSTNTPNSDAKK